jgi:WG repeat protein
VRRQLLAVLFTLACPRPAVPVTEAPVAAREDPGGPPQPFEGEGGRFGYRDASGREILPARYAVAMEFAPSGVAFVVDEQGWACIDATGSVRLRPFVFDNGPDYPSEGVFRYVDNGRFGFADLACRPTIPAAWEFAGPFAEQRAPVCRGCSEAHGEHAMPRGGKWGFIDPQGHEVIAAEWDFALPFEQGEARVERRGLPRRITKAGALVPVRTEVRLVELATKDRDAVLTAIRERRDSIAGCADEQQRRTPASLPVARADLAAGGGAMVKLPSDDGELAECLVTALRSIALPATLTLRMGESADERALPAAPPDEAIAIGDDGRCSWVERFPCRPHKMCKAPEPHRVACPQLLAP